MRLSVTALVFLICALTSACNISLEREPTPPPPTQFTPPTSTPVDIATPTTAPVNTPTSIPPTTIVIPPTSCVPRTDLPTYTVALGDTLANIARRANTTTSVLTGINCLANPNVISVGQVLRVPTVILPPTNTPTNIQVVGAVAVSPVLRVEGDINVLVPDGVVTLTWNVPGLTNVPASTSRMQFYVTPSGTGTTPVLIGTDANLTDGGAITWRVPNSALGWLSAEIVSIDYSVQARTATSTRIAVEWQTPVPAPTIVSFTASSASINAGGSITLNWEVRDATGVSIRVINPDGNEAARFDHQALKSTLNYTVPLTVSGTLTFRLVPESTSSNIPTQQITVTVVLPPSEFDDPVDHDNTD
ncbi:MAG: LysM peptidoglycan-binding domain-containing protein [Anaerolineae bacterium]|nr:LysM peptidoglycan-binding domain-containing protein [Anaerolineae bacterium]